MDEKNVGRILIADDQKNVRSSLKFLLEQQTGAADKFVFGGNTVYPVHLLFHPLLHLFG